MILFQYIGWLNVLLPTYRYIPVPLDFQQTDFDLFCWHLFQSQAALYFKNYTKILHKNHTKFLKNFPIHTPKSHPFFPNFPPPKSPKILHLHIHTFPITPTLLFHFYLSHITPNYINLSQITLSSPIHFHTQSHNSHIPFRTHTVPIQPF